MISGFKVFMFMPGFDHPGPVRPYRVFASWQDDYVPEILQVTFSVFSPIITLKCSTDVYLHSFHSTNKQGKKKNTKCTL